jgi:heme/copper-type cytochrome/quinol oxidase subunit 3
VSDVVLAAGGAADPERGATTSIGMIVALSALGMTFAALLLAYAIVRTQSPAWPPPGEAPLPPLWGWRVLATVTSLAGSVAMAATARRARTGRDARGPLAAAAGSGLAFLAAQAAALVALGRAGAGPGAGLAASVVYALCSFHALHVVAALLALTAVLGAVRAGAGGALPPARLARVDAVAAFWHLVTAVWCVVFLGVFVL